jgi:hypothetical protein
MHIQAYDINEAWGPWGSSVSLLKGAAAQLRCSFHRDIDTAEDVRIIGKGLG